MPKLFSSLRNSVGPDQFVAITGKPIAMASTIGRPHPSPLEGSTNASADLIKELDINRLNNLDNFGFVDAALDVAGDMEISRDPNKIHLVTSANMLSIDPISLKHGPANHSHEVSIPAARRTRPRPPPERKGAIQRTQYGALGLRVWIRVGPEFGFGLVEMMGFEVFPWKSKSEMLECPNGKRMMAMGVENV
ncbi:hypothetical protein V2J09_001223 [Rumex salicifolius]